MTATATLSTDITSAIAALKAKLPSALQPWADTYGPVVLGWAQADLQAWLQMIVAGDIYGAYAKVLAGMGNQQAVDNWATIQQGWAQANADNASRVQLGQKAIQVFLGIVLSIALAAVGL